MRFTLPRSVNDFLFDDLQNKLHLESTVRRLFSLWGYDELLPAGLDFFDNFSHGAGARSQEEMLKSFDGQGRILVMRPEFTAQIARLAATKLLRQAPPLRLCYLGQAYANPQNGAAGRLAEFTQAGVELMGEPGPMADAEVIMLALRCMRESGLENCLIELGQVEFFNGLMEEAGLSAEAIAELQRHVEEKNALAIELLLRAEGVDERAAKQIQALPMLFGGEEVLDAAEKMSNHPKCVRAIQNIKQVYGLLQACGLQDHISIDLGMVHSLSYYTGVVFRGIVGSFGRPLLTGGRYDTLLEDFGRPMPATGFGLGIENLMQALQKQGAQGCSQGLDVLYVVQSARFGYGLARAQALREQGLRVELCFFTSEAEIKAHAQRRGAKQIVFDGEGQP